MQGSSIKQAREALALCVSSLPVGASFNIMSFGSSCSKYSKDAVIFGDST
jgi:hypothetical protein